jgi:dynein assembly factor 2, axonemal
VADLQNPEYRAETEAYIGQLENEDKVPQGKELIRPEKGFVAKSRKKDQKDKTDTKVFINIVQSEKITKPTKTDTAKGQNWSLPYSLGPPHMEKDKVSSIISSSSSSRVDIPVVHSRHGSRLVGGRHAW